MAQGKDMILPTVLLKIEYKPIQIVSTVKLRIFIIINYACVKKKNLLYILKKNLECLIESYLDTK